LQFYSEGRAPRVLLSMTASEARYFASRTWPLGDHSQNARELLANLPTKIHVFVHLHRTQVTVDFVRLGWFGTWGEIQALHDWLEEHPQLASILVISTAPHLRRVRLCCRAALPQHVSVNLCAVPPYLFWDRQKWWLLRRTRLAVLWEFPKLTVYWFLARLAPPRLSQLRGHLERAQGD